MSSFLTWRRKQIQFPKRRVFCSLEYRTMDKVQKPSNSVCHPPLSEPFRIYKEILVLWDVTPCSPLKINQRFERIFCLNFSGSKFKPSKKPELKICLIFAYFCFLFVLFFYPEDWGVIPPRRQRTPRCYMPEDRTLHKPPLWEPQILQDRTDL
jgi:hypothetical protein